MKKRTSQKVQHAIICPRILKTCSIILFSLIGNQYEKFQPEIPRVFTLLTNGPQQQQFRSFIKEIKKQNKKEKK